MLNSFSLKAALAALCSLGMAAASHAAVVSATELARPDGARAYLMVTPEHPAPGKHPLVILLHGHGGTAAQLLGRERLAAPLSVWLQIAEREQLLLAAPDGKRGADGKQGWNDCRADATSNPKSDDVGMVKAVIARAIAEHDADPTRIYVMGMSNGGFMTMRLAVELGAQLAGVATVGASTAANSLCPAPAAPISVLMVAGTADPVVPYAGGEIRFFALKSRGAVTPVEDAALAWRQLDRLATAPQTTEVPHRDRADPTHATRFLWGADPRRLQVGLIKVDQGGHAEPSIAKRLPWAYTMLVGAQNGDLEIAEEAWAFFKDKRAGLQP